MKIKPFVLKLLSCNCNLLQIKQRVGYENPSKETLGYAPGSSKEIEEEKGNIRRRVIASFGKIGSPLLYLLSLFNLFAYLCRNFF